MRKPTAGDPAVRKNARVKLLGLGRTTPLRVVLIYSTLQHTGHSHPLLSSPTSVGCESACEASKRRDMITLCGASIDEADAGVNPILER